MSQSGECDLKKDLYYHKWLYFINLLIPGTHIKNHHENILLAITHNVYVQWLFSLVGVTFKA